MAHSVILGIFSTKEKVETAVDEMQRESFRNADISVLFRRNEGTEDFASGALGSLADIGVLANPGLGPLIAAGPIMSLLSEANAAAAFSSFMRMTTSGSGRPGKFLNRQAPTTSPGLAR